MQGSCDEPPSAPQQLLNRTDTTSCRRRSGADAPGPKRPVSAGACRIIRWVNDTFSARAVATDVLEQLERRREAIAADPDLAVTAFAKAMVPWRTAYHESELPLAYFDALEDELRAVLPLRFRSLAGPFTELERSGYGSWRGGDVYARLLYVLVGLTVGGLIIAAPFIPIWEKWFPLALAVAAWWLPDAQAAWHRRRHARQLGAIAVEMGHRQAALEARVTVRELAPR